MKFYDSLDLSWPLVPGEIKKLQFAHRCPEQGSLSIAFARFWLKGRGRQKNNIGEKSHWKSFLKQLTLFHHVSFFCFILFLPSIVFDLSPLSAIVGPWVPIHRMSPMPETCPLDISCPLPRSMCTPMMIL